MTVSVHTQFGGVRLTRSHIGPMWPYVNWYQIQTYPITSHASPPTRTNQTAYFDTMIKTHTHCSNKLASTIDCFAFATLAIVALDIPCIAFPSLLVNKISLDFDAVLHKSSVKLQIAFPNLLCLQYGCGKLRQSNILLLEKEAGGHWVLVFTQMTHILDILKLFLNFHEYIYLHLQKQRINITLQSAFNADSRNFLFIA